MQLCEDTKKQYTVSDTDISIINTLYDFAQQNYSLYRENELFKNIIEYCNQGMYYEARDELSWITYSSLTQSEKDTYQALKKRIDNAIENLKPIPYVGMAKEDIVNSRWGRPNRIDTWYDSVGTHEQWCYYNDPVYHYKYIFITNGVVTSISTILE